MVTNVMEAIAATFWVDMEAVGSETLVTMYKTTRRQTQKTRIHTTGKLMDGRVLKRHQQFS
jgi:hypothetical protein